MKRRIAVLVSNDLNHDQRVLKTCATLAKAGWTPVLLGRELPGSSPLNVPYEAHRMRLPFHRGALFYAALQWGLFRRLPGLQCQAIWSNDLDTLLPAFLVARRSKLPLVYDSHEFFTEAAGLTGRPFQRGVWMMLERALFPRVKAVITVNESIARAYAKRYPDAGCGVPLVVRNMPRKQGDSTPVSAAARASDRDWRAELSIPRESTFLILQGAFLDVDRGVVQAVEALRNQPDWWLVVVGAGAEWEWANAQTTEFGGRLICLPKMPFETLRTLTAAADVGLSLDRGVHGNYWMSLPNKLFDYIHAGRPVVASSMPEVARIVNEHGIGVVTESLEPEGIAAAVQAVMGRPAAEWRSACRTASEVLHWEADEPNILEALARAGAR